MEPGKISKQFISFQKNLFENTYNSVAMLQDQAASIATSIFNQFPLMSDESKKAICTTLDLYKEARLNFKKAVDDGFDKIGEIGFTKFDELFKE